MSNTPAPRGIPQAHQERGGGYPGGLGRGERDWTMTDRVLARTTPLATAGQDDRATTATGKFHSPRYVEQVR